MPVQINHGIKNEVKATNAYCSRTGFTVHKCGLLVNPSVPWIGAYPDGLVKDPAERNSFGLLEIKCPCTQRFSTVEDACSDSSFFAEIKSGLVTLKENHKHFFQIQGQNLMALSKIPWCDFVIYTHCNFTIQRIRFNDDLWNDMHRKLTEFYFKYILSKTCTLAQETNVNNQVNIIQ